MAHFDDLDPEFFGLLALVRIHGADAHLDQAFGRAFFHDAGKWTGVRQAVALKFVVEIGMRIEVDDG